MKTATKSESHNKEYKEAKEDKTMSTRELKALADLAIELVEAGYSECVFSDMEYYPVMTEEFPEVKELTDTEEFIVIETMEKLLG